MKVVILNGNNALVLEASSATPDESGNIYQINTNCATIESSVSRTLKIDGNDEVVNNIIEGLIGEDYTVNYYNPYTKEKYTKIKKQNKVKALEKTYLNK